MEGFEARQSIDLARENGVLRRAQPIERGDVKALRWVVTVTRNGEPEDLSGATAAIYCARTNAPTVRSDEDIIIDGNTVSGFLPQDAANAPGLVVCEFSIAHGSDGPAFVLARMTLEASDTIGDDVIDQGSRIPGYEQLLAEIEAMRQATQEARQATQSANEQAQAAQTAASNASTQASAAQQAAQKIHNLSATAQTLAPGSQATANVSSTENGFEVKLGIPTGAAGPVPNITFTVKTGDPGTDVEIIQGGTPEAPTVTLTIPRGMPGTGSVSSVCGVQPDTEGDVPVSAENVGALYPDPDDQTTDTDVPTPINADMLNGVSLSEIMLKLYPVGAVYISTSSIDPGALFGGVWEAIKDRFLLSAGNSYAAGATGGEVTHMLKIEELPAHQHLIAMNQAGESDYWGPVDAVRQTGTNHNVTLPTGGNQPHNNMPPYLAVYMWKRVR